MRKIIFLFLTFAVALSFTYAQQYTKEPFSDNTWKPITLNPDAKTAIFIDDMNGDNTEPGLNARGWFFDDVDGAGATTIYQGITSVFTAYEGPDTGYVAQNYSGAFSGGFLIDQWLISPEVTVAAGDTLKFWHRSPDGSIWPDPLEVWVSSTAGTTAVDFDIQLDAFDASVTGWQQYVGNFTGAGTVRFAVRYYTTDGGPAGNESNYVGMDLFEVESGGGTSLFFDDFDSYTAGLQLVGQSGGEWDTWSGTPGTSEDPFVSDAYSWSGSNTVVITPDIDLIRYHGEQTSGKWYISFFLYIPAGASGYFNSMSGFTPNPFQWAHEVYFDVGGGGRLMGVPGAPIAFTWVEDTWQQAMVVVDLDTDNAEFWFGDSDPLTMVSSWQWTQGATVNLQLDATDFFGAAATEEMYVDDYYFSDTPPVIIPVELTSFTASVNENDVTLNWVTASEINNQGFEIERNSGNGYENIGYVAGFGTTTETHSYSFVDASLSEGTYTYRLKQVDLDGTFAYSDAVEVDVTVPDVFVLEQNYPNPFNPSTKIDFSLAIDSKVSLKVFDILGQEVATLINSDLVAGSHNVDFDASLLNSGVYFYRIEATGIDGTNFTNVKKMILTK